MITFTMFICNGYFKDTPKTTDGKTQYYHGKWPKKPWYYHSTCPQKIWYYHGKCPKNGFNMVIVQKHGITVVHATKKYGITMVDAPKTWYYQNNCPKNMVLPE